MDMNMVLLEGRLAAQPEHRLLDSGSRMTRLLVAVRSDEPHSRLDVLPVVWWEPNDEFTGAPPQVGSRILVTGSLQRRYWESADGRRSKIEAVANQVSLPVDDPKTQECRTQSRL